MEKEIYGFIYCITFPNGKKYIGQTTKEIEERIKEHICVSRRDAQYVLSKAIRKYGENTIIYEPIDIAHDRDELNMLEIEYILFYNTHYLKGNGYNMTDGGEGVVGYRHTEESKRIMSEKSKLYFSDASNCIAKSIEVKKYFENPENKLRLINQLKSYYINNPEAKKNMSIRMTEYFSNHENRLKQSKIKKEFYKNNPEAKKNMSIRMTEYFSNHENREIMSNIKKEFHKNNPEIAKEHSERMKEIHKNNPEIAKEHSERMKEIMNGPGVKEEISQRMKEIHKNNPEIAKAHSERMKEFMNRPDVKEANSKRMKEFMNRPDVKEANSKRMKERGQTLEGKIRGPPKPFNVYYEEKLIGNFDYVPFAIDYLQKNRDITISGGCIRRVLYGERNHTHGYKFEYVS
jgi:hypothetical protein